MAWPGKPISTVRSADSRRSSGYMPPCTIPNNAWVCSRAELTGFLLEPGNLVLVRLEILLAAAGPARGHLHGLAGALVGGGELGALVKGHDDVGAEADLGGQRGFRREKVQRAVQVRAELHAILGELAQLAEAEDLEAA